MDDIVMRLRKRAEIRRNIPTRKSVQQGEADRIADLLEEAATEIERERGEHCEACDNSEWSDECRKRGS